MLSFSFPVPSPSADRADRLVMAFAPKPPPSGKQLVKPSAEEPQSAKSGPWPWPGSAGTWHFGAAVNDDGTLDFQ